MSSNRPPNVPWQESFSYFPFRPCRTIVAVQLFVWLFHTNVYLICHCIPSAKDTVEHISTQEALVWRSRTPIHRKGQCQRGQWAVLRVTVASKSGHYENSFVGKKEHEQITTMFFIFLVFLCIIKLFSKSGVWLGTQFPLRQEYRMKWFIPRPTCLWKFFQSEIDPVGDFSK